MSGPRAGVFGSELFVAIYNPYRRGIASKRSANRGEASICLSQTKGLVKLYVKLRKYSTMKRHNKLIGRRVLRDAQMPYEMKPDINIMQNMSDF